MTASIIFKLWHFHLRGGEPWDMRDAEMQGKSLGGYATRAEAEAAIRRHIGAVGFRDWPGGFRIIPLRLNEDRAEAAWYGPDPNAPTPEEERAAPAPPSTYVQLEHWNVETTPDDPDDLMDTEEENGKLLGIYSTEGAAQAARARFAQRYPELARFPDGFRIYTDGKVGPESEGWTEGFIRMDEM